MSVQPVLHHHLRLGPPPAPDACASRVPGVPERSARPSAELGPPSSPGAPAASDLAPIAVDRAASGRPPLPPAPVGDETTQAQAESEAAADARQAREIRARTEAEEAVGQARLEAIRAEMQTEILKIWQEVLIRRQKVMAELLEKWWRVIFS